MGPFQVADWYIALITATLIWLSLPTVKESVFMVRHSYEMEWGMKGIHAQYNAIRG